MAIIISVTFLHSRRRIASSLFFFSMRLRYVLYNASPCKLHQMVMVDTFNARQRPSNKSKIDLSGCQLLYFLNRGVLLLRLCGFLFVFLLNWRPISRFQSKAERWFHRQMNKKAHTFITSIHKVALKNDDIQTISIHVSFDMYTVSSHHWWLTYKQLSIK